jgi:hypothetical protein
MRIFFAFVMAMLLFGGFLARPGGAASSRSDGHSSRHIRAPRADVVDALRAMMRQDGMELVSRADDGDRYRAVIPAARLNADPKFSGAGSVVGDVVITARVHPGGAVIDTGFSANDTSARFEVAVTAGEGGQGSDIAVTGTVEEGHGPVAHRLAESMRRLLDSEAGTLLDTIARGAGG